MRNDVSCCRGGPRRVVSGSSPAKRAGAIGFELRPQALSAFAAVVPLRCHLAMLMAVDQGDDPAGDDNAVAINVGALYKAEHMRIVTQALLASGVGSGHGW